MNRCNRSRSYSNASSAMSGATRHFLRDANALQPPSKTLRTKTQSGQLLRGENGVSSIDLPLYPRRHTQIRSPGFGLATEGSLKKLSRHSSHCKSHCCTLLNPFEIRTYRACCRRMAARVSGSVLLPGGKPVTPHVGPAAGPFPTFPVHTATPLSEKSFCFKANQEFLLPYHFVTA